MKQDNLSSIGTIETVDLPSCGIVNVLAKIDTGADSSAIWASNIREVNGTLSFMLFGPTSPYYNAKEIKTRKYSLVTVRNSFGQKEIRYKVELKIKIAKRNINCRFTLANRINNRFPVLIGRRTLRGKFLVDVAKKNSLIKDLSLAVLADASNSNAKHFVNSATQDGLDVQLMPLEDFIFNISQTKPMISLVDTTMDLTKCNLVYFMNNIKTPAGCLLATIAYYLDYHNIDYVDRSVSHCRNLSRLYLYFVLAMNHILVPEAFYVSSLRATNYKMVEASIGSPFLLVDNNDLSIEAKTYLIRKESDYQAVVKLDNSSQTSLLALQNINYDADFIIFVVGGQASIAIKRTLTRDYVDQCSIKTKILATNKIDVNDLPSSVINDVIAAVKLVRLQMAEVNITQDKSTKIWYCLGVVNSPENTQSEFMDEKHSAIIKYLSQRLND